MGAAVKIVTERLILRTWCEDDLAPLSRLNDEAEVNRWLGGAAAARLGRRDLLAMNDHLEKHRWGICAVCDPRDKLIGLAGFRDVSPRLPISPAVEAVWRLTRRAWGFGYIVEALSAMLSAERPMLPPQETIALIARPNERSAATASRLGFMHAAELDFDHPLLATLDPLRPHRVFVRRAGDAAAKMAAAASR